MQQYMLKGQTGLNGLLLYEATLNVLLLHVNSSSCCDIWIPAKVEWHVKSHGPCGKGTPAIQTCVCKFMQYFNIIRYGNHIRAQGMTDMFSAIMVEQQVFYQSDRIKVTLVPKSSVCQGRLQLIEQMQLRKFEHCR